MTKPKVAIIGTGGTIHSLGLGPFDILDYGAQKNMMAVTDLVEMFPEVKECADLILVPYKAVPSPDIFFDDWKAIVAKMDELTASEPDLAGFVVTHGTASMEETAYFLSLTARTPLPIVCVGSQRPASGLSTDAAMNLANAIRTAAAPEARGMGGMLLLNDEIHSAREVTKTSTFRLQTFRSPDFGVLGHADGDKVVFYRKPIRTHYPDTEFDISKIDSLPRVDVIYAYTGCDATAAKAFVAAGAKGIVCAGFAPGSAGTPSEEYLAEAVKAGGLTVMISTRAGSGRVFKGKRHAERGFLTADNLNPQKARLLLSLALAVTDDPAEIERIFLTY
ncbi:asparaginase [Oceanicola sp. 22II-s10i]|uniref:asparaginase n=1 Tax=Oceanicola sp. 22II-s10i TaxID=1317116 RepID=UPI000B528C38|nr:asparaginase [Oceanicola sp. 22II-s10i]OWU83492.1 asparaginase [Oceanicola sp. 22II-s10i]